MKNIRFNLNKIKFYIIYILYFIFKTLYFEELNESLNFLVCVLSVTTECILILIGISIYYILA